MSDGEYSTPPALMMAGLERADCIIKSYERWLGEMAWIKSPSK